jgi:sigma-B regulation protein RsbU (phosphoserine phosphatase)
MALSRIVVRVNALWHRDPAKVIYHSNNAITQDSKSGMFVTLFFGILNENNHSLTYVNAGHNPPLFFHNHDGSVEKFMPTGIVLGAVENKEYSSKNVKIAPDDVIVMYTDGVTESVNSKQEMFGEKRLIEIIQRKRHLTAQCILNEILIAVKAFSGDNEQLDDITLLVIKGTQANKRD